MTREVWHIVIVDDSPDDRAETRRLLLTGSDRRYTFAEAETGAAGIRALAEWATEPHRCIVLDYNLPDMAAPGFLAAISGGDGAPGWPVVVFTGVENATTGRSSLRAGAHDYVGKQGLTSQVLVRAVENAAERWAMARELRQQRAAAQVSEQHFRALAQATADIVYRMSADWSLMHPLDGRALVTSSDKPLTDWAWLHQNVPADEHDRVRQAIGEAIAQKALFSLEHRVLRPDRSIGWTASRAVPLLDENGNVVEWFGAASDISQRKSDEQALARSEAFSRGVVDASADCMKGLTLDGRVLWMNDNGQRLMEVDDFAALRGRDWASTWAAGGLRAEAEAALATARGGGIGRFSGFCPTAAGTPRWWDVAVSAIPGRDGLAEQLLVVSRDVTAQRAADEVTRGLAERLRLAVDSSAVVLFQQDRELRYTWIYNPALGFEVSEVVGKRDVDLIESAADAEVMSALKREVMRTGVGGRHEVIVHHRGVAHCFRLRIEPMRDAAGVIVGVTCAAIDITELRTSTEAAARSARELQTLADNTPDILARYDRQLRHVFVNAAIERVTGRTPAEFIGKTNRDLGMPIELCDIWDPAIVAIFEEGDSVSLEFSYGEGAEVRHFRCALVPERGSTGEVVSVLGVTRERTEEKQAQDALRTADRRKDEFLATLAHELRNPLAPIRTGLQILRLTKDPAIAHRTLLMAERQLGQMVRLIDDLLDVSRISSGKLVLRLARMELQTAVHTAIEAVRPLLDAAAQVLRVELPAEPIWLNADDTRICQILNNLLTNASKYSPRGRSITLGVHRAGADVVVTVADQGEGIPQDMLGQVFEMFTQVDRTLDRAQGGLGIGLALVKRLVEMHGGTVSAESAGLGAGSTFTLRLPSPEASASVDGSGTQSEEAVSHSRLRVLVVDDNVDAADSLAELLALYGHETQVANSGVSALAMVRDFKPAVVFMDIGMPGMNGHETARRIRAGQQSASVTLVALTGWGAEADRVEAREAGFDHHFTKPLELAKVEDLLQQVALRQSGSGSASSAKP